MFNVVVPDTYNVDLNETLKVPSVNIAPLNDAGNLVVLSVDIQSNLPKFGCNAIMGFVAFCANFVLSPINNTRELTLLIPSKRATPSVDV